VIRWDVGLNSTPDSVSMVTSQAKVRTPPQVSVVSLS